MKTAKMMCKMLEKIELLELENKALKENMERTLSTSRHWVEECDRLQKMLEETKQRAEKAEKVLDSLLEDEETAPFNSFKAMEEKKNADTSD